MDATTYVPHCPAVNRDGYDCELPPEHEGVHRALIGASDEDGPIPEVQWCETPAGSAADTTPAPRPAAQREPWAELRRLAEAAQEAEDAYNLAASRGPVPDALAIAVMDTAHALEVALSPATVLALLDAADAGERMREAVERAYRFAWAFCGHNAACPLAVDINAPDSTACTCGYDEQANALMDDEDALGFDFWKNARVARAGQEGAS